MKNLIREVHRRSLWQVLGIYLAVSWVVLQVVDVVGNNFGLPEWVAPAALVLLLLGLPVVIATAFVQEGMTVKDPEPGPQSSADAGEVRPPSAPRPARHRRMFTWRNALLGGGAAFALLGLLTAGYLFMRASGIGPAGTLVAQGVLEDGAKVILADFDGPDPDLADVVTGALLIDLLQSPVIRIVERAELAAALERMQLDEDAPITADLARELAAREGYGAVIQGEIGTAGAGYVLTASIVGGEDWTSLDAFRSTARGEDGLIDAIESLSRDIRDKAGESLRSLRNAPALDRVTTTSIDALRVYTRAEVVEDSDREGAVELYERAIELDPDFAMAHRKLGVVLGNMGIRRTDQVAATKRAYELRDRLPEAEAYLAEADYSDQVLGDSPSAIRAYERLLEIDPDNISALNNLALQQVFQGRIEEAEALLERALDVEAFQVGFANLAFSRWALGDAEGSDAVLDVGSDALPGAAPILEDVRIRLAIAGRELERAAALADAYEERFLLPAAGVRLATNRYILDAVHGRFAGAIGRVDEFDEAPSFAGHPVVMSTSRNMLVGMRGDTAAAVRAIVATFDEVRATRPPAERLYDVAIPFLLDLGAETPATELFEEWRSEVPEEELGTEGRHARREVEARLAHVRGDYEEAVGRWETYERACPGWCATTASLGLATTYDAAGDRDAAIEQYERFLADRGRDRAHMDALYRAPAIERLGHLYADRGDAEDASRHLRAFVELWADADEELQPRVRAARARLEALGRQGVAPAGTSGAGS